MRTYSVDVGFPPNDNIRIADNFMVILRGLCSVTGKTIPLMGIMPRRFG